MLATCLSRLAWSPEQLAREINHSRGPGTISEKAPYNWLRGSCPRRDLPHVVAELLSERLGEHIAVEAIWPQHFSAMSGLTKPTAPRRMPWHPVPPTAEQPLVTAALDWLVADNDAIPSRARGGDLPRLP
ncbi:hypothetical protein Srufu_068830 [Streptomyces libani subsp. rufus]|nr:hypothetical protein Srufu_068830 [Streptomyces libani subsp. rufus]